MGIGVLPLGKPGPLGLAGLEAIGWRPGDALCSCEF